MKKNILGILLILLTSCTINPSQSSQPSPNVTPSEQPKQTAERKPQMSEQNTQNQTKSGDIISTYSTKILDKKKERVNNIKKAVQMITNITLQPDQIFSFNDTVGKRTKEAGYQKAYIFIGEDKKLDYGGGVCQISSTIYNAAIGANLEIVERHPHEQKVDYVPEGQDATVSYGRVDLKFKNSKPFPIILSVRVIKNNVVADIIRK